MLQLRTSNFGRSKSNATGSTGVGYSVYDTVGSIITPRTTVGVYQLVSGSGVYAAFVQFNDSFRGSVVWDTGSAFPTASYAIEEYNYEANNPLVDQMYATQSMMSGTLGQLYDIEYGRWRIDAATNKMIFYKADNSTVVAEFNLFDSVGTPTIDSVFDRRRA